MSSPREQLPLYLGAQLSRWLPRTTADVQAAIDDGSLAERHWLDAKAPYGTTEGANKEMARDLSSFAIDGGALLIGVSEPVPRQLVVSGVELAGLGERVERVARARCDPPLYVVCHPLVDPADHSRGVLLVEVPPSPAAPHMVDGRYYGRGDTTKDKLTDQEVARLHAVRSARQLTAEQVFARELARDPVPAGHRRLSHLVVVAEPLASPPDLLTDWIGNSRLTDLVGSVPARVPRAREVPPSWDYFSKFNEPRAEGAGFASYGVFGRQLMIDMPQAEERGVLDLEISDSGRITLFAGGGSAVPRHVQGDLQVLRESAALVLARQVVVLAGDIGVATGYAGRWMLTLGISDTFGKFSSAGETALVMGRLTVPFSAPQYVQGTEAVTVELRDRPGAVTGRLMKRLLRGLGVGDGQHDHLLAEHPAT